MKILLWVFGVSLAWRWLLRWAAPEPDRVIGGGVADEALSFTAPDNQAAAEVLIALSAIPVGVTYRIDWIQERTPGR